MNQLIPQCKEVSFKSKFYNVFITLSFPFESHHYKNLSRLIRTLFILIVVVCLSYGKTSSQTSFIDQRIIENGVLIQNNKYIDQPYVLKLPNNSWICFYTKSDTTEGCADIIVGVSISYDKGKSWVPQPYLDIAPSNYSNPILTSKGRIYVFYTFNKDKVWYINVGKTVFYIVGSMAYKYSDDYGITWSDRQYINIPMTGYDSTNVFKGKYQTWWQICKPIMGNDNEMYMSFTKNTIKDTHEGWVLNSPNIDTEKNTGNLVFNFFPANTSIGIRSPTMGGAQEEHNIVQLSDGTFYMLFRTVDGFIGKTISTDKCRTWSVPQPLLFPNGDTVRHTRACPRVFKCNNGKYLLWFENNSYVSGHRNPAWVSGGIEQNGTINWSQPEILLYSRTILLTTSYPDLIEDNGNYYITETDKKNARFHQIDTALLNGMWQQGLNKTPVTRGLITDWDNKQIKDSTGLKLAFINQTGNLKWKGITIAFQAERDSLTPGKLLIPIISSNACCGNESLINVLVRPNGNIGVDLYYGGTPPNTLDFSWDCDAKFLSAGTNTISITIDSFTRIITFMVNGILVRGNSTQLQGWATIQANWQNILIKYILLTGDASCIKRLKVFNSALTVSEQIQDYLGFNTLTASVTSTSSGCLNGVSPNVTFKGFTGLAPYTFTYTINGGSNKTVSTKSGSSVNVAVPTNVGGNIVYSLVSVSDSSGNLQPVNSSVTVTIKQPTVSTTFVGVCPSSLPYTWNGTSYTKFGIYTVHLTNATGCDSAASLNLNTLIPGNIGSTLTGCDSLVYKGNTYTGSTVINDTIRSYKGCDSIYNLIHVNINKTISGKVLMHSAAYSIPSVIIHLTGTINDSVVLKDCYSFKCLPETGNYTIKLKKNNDITKSNGVSSIDAALIQSHILQKSLLNSPYKIIAADVTGDGRVSALDIVMIKRVILGLDTTFIKTSSGEKRMWVFVDSCYKFPDSTNPFPYKDSISYSGLLSSKYNQTFIGMKLGDVNCDWNIESVRLKGEIRLSDNIEVEEEKIKD